ncbi:MAG: DUF885 domain-containing protein [Acidobacteria bacterium]|nr:MAG: DUF885 domain-containing protein [Acidobacteriota bacterium]
MQSPLRLRGTLSVLMLGFGATISCSDRPAQPPPSGAGPGDAAFTELARQILDDHHRRHPSVATDLGLHQYDAELEDASEAAIHAESQALQQFRTKLAAIDAATLTTDRQLDREQLQRALDAGVLALDRIRQWAKDPDSYSGAITNSAYVIMKRNYAPASERLTALIAREKKMPGVLLEARKNLGSPPGIYTEIAIEQIDGNIRFFKNDLPAAFTEVSDKALLDAFRKSNDDVIGALGDYKTYLQKTLLAKSTGSFAYGDEVYRLALADYEMIDMSPADLLSTAEADRRKNEAAFQATARQIDANKSADQVLAAMQADHPPADKLLQATQDTLDSIRQFIVDHHIITIPPSDPAKVKETPPFMRSTTSASMDTPGPFERAKLVAYYNMTLPDPRWSAAERADFMRQWYYAAIANTSVHEVYPGHYTQFLYAKDFPSDVRKVYGAASNAEGWAHYAEQMMLDEGFHAGEPKYRLAQLQDALLRDVRFIVGIKMHVQGMDVGEATKLFETAGHQPHPVAVSEAKRGTSDALYGYYTMGKLMILKLREDYKAKKGSGYSLRGFHDAFIRIGPLPLPLIRRAMLGDVGQLF